MARWPFRRGRRWATTALGLALGLGLSEPSEAASPTQRFDIPAQDLTRALRSYALQADRQVLFSDTVGSGVTTRPLAGRFTADEALQRLLGDSRFVVVRLASGVLYVHSAPPTRAAALPNGPPATGARVPRPETLRPTPGLANLEADVLGEVVVTATRRAETANQAPLSLSAITRQALDQQGLANLYDLSRAAPALTFRRIGSDGSTTLAIRGIFSIAGSPSTGVFLDDIPLQKRFAEGGATGNGTPIPELFDLDRVEVLRGPQGTLFGGSSEGGAFRFITPRVSLSERSLYVRAGAADTQGGAVSGEAGLALGGPIVADRLGFRASLHLSRVGGYLDHVRPQTGQTWLTDSNSENHVSGRLALRWRPGPRDEANLSLFRSRVSLNDTDAYWENVPAYTVPAGGFNALGLPTGDPAQIAFSRPAKAYPALDFYGPGRTGSPETSPRRNELDLVSLTLDHDLGWASLKSITGYIHDKSKTRSDLPNDILNIQGVFGGYLQDVPDFRTPYYAGSRRKAWMQEFRLSSPPASRLDWVAGLFYFNQATASYSRLIVDLDPVTQALRGVPAAVFFGTPSPDALLTARDQALNEVSLAAFGEINLPVTRRLKLIAGLRASYETFKYDTTLYGQSTGVLVPTFANAGHSVGKLGESPVLPKVGVSYRLADRDLLYATVSRGFRPGGVNPSLPLTPPCAAAAALIGGAAPARYAADYVLNYEAGAKIRLAGGRAQVNSSAFYIDWSGVQTRLSLPGCSFLYVANAGTAVSKGFESEAALRLVRGLTAELSLSYTDARYTRTVYAPAAGGGQAAAIVGRGDQLPVPVWTAGLGVRYDVQRGRRDLYARVDYRYASGYHRTFGPGTTTFSPEIYQGGAAHLVNVRAGLAAGRMDVSLYVNNLLNFQQPLNLTGGRTGCANEACSSFRTAYYNLIGTTLQPRTVGLTLTFRE